MHCRQPESSSDQYMFACVQGVSLEDVKSKIVSTDGPKMNNTTQPDYVKFHDDKVRQFACLPVARAHVHQLIAYIIKYLVLIDGIHSGFHPSG